MEQPGGTAHEPGDHDPLNPDPVDRRVGQESPVPLASAPRLHPDWSADAGIDDDDYERL